MDASNFAVQFDPVRAGLIKVIEEEFCSGARRKKCLSTLRYTS